MADIVDTMFGWLVDIFGWILEKLLKLCGWILKLIWSGIVGLFKLIFKKKETTISSGQDFTSEDGTPQMQSFDELLSDIDGLKESGTRQDKLMNIELTALLHNTLSFAQKARILKKGEDKLTELGFNVTDRASFFGDMVNNAYALINDMTGNAIQEQVDKYKAALDPMNQEVELEPLGNYIINIMNTVSAMNAPDGRSSFKREMLEGVELPSWSGNNA